MGIVRSSDAFRDIDRFLQQFWVSPDATRTHSVPMDVYRKADSFLIQVDLPGVDPNKIELTVENNILTVSAERTAPASVVGVERMIGERAFGTYTRQVFLGTNLDSEKIQADYDAGVLTIAIPIAEHARARKIEVSGRENHQAITTN